MSKENKEEKKEEKKDTIEIDKESYKSMMDEIKGLKQKQEILMQTADKKSMARYMQQHKEDQPQIMKLGKMDGRVIVGWTTEKNKVGKNENGAWFEEQITKVIFDDGSHRILPYKQFVENYSKFNCKRIGVEHDEEKDKIYYKLESLEENTMGETYKVENRFVNP